MLPHLLQRIINIRHHQWSVYLTAYTFINAILLNVYNIYFLFVLLQYVTTTMPILNLFTSYNVLMLLNNKHRNKAIVDYTSPMLCSLVIPIPADMRCGLSSTCRRRNKPWTWATCTKNLVKIMRVVPEISSWTDRHIDRHTYHSTSQLLLQAK